MKPSFWKLCPILLLIAIITVCHARADEFLGVSARRAITPTHAVVCLVEFANNSPTLSAQRIDMVLYDRDEPRLRIRVPELAPTRRVVIEGRPYSQTTCLGGDVFFRVSYVVASTPHETILSSVPNSSWRQTDESSVNKLIATLIAPSFLFLGTVLGHWLTMSRERKKEEIERRTKSFQEKEESIRIFLADWGASPVAEILRNNFIVLRRRVLLGCDILAAYDETFKALSDAQLGLDVKCTSAKNFESALTEHIQKCDPPERA